MKKASVLLVALALSLAAASPKPKLVLAIVVDQFRYDYLTRFRAGYSGGFERLLTHGAVFTNANYRHFPTVTAVGHSTFLTGATPSLSGIIENDWFDRDEGKRVTSVSDDDAKLLGGGTGAGASPRRLLVDTLGDEMKMADPQARVIGISLKDRSAILPAGHMADGAYWFDAAGGNFVSSTYYFQDLPAWVKDFNQARPADRYLGAEWLNHRMPPEPKKLYPALAASPFGNELIESLAERALDAERLGSRGSTDLLAVSFSSNDYVGHQAGPDAPEVKEMSLRTDRLLEKLLAAVDGRVGLDHVLVVLTGDHGVAPMPEVNAGRRMPGGRMPDGVLAKTVQAALLKKYGAGQWVAADFEFYVYLNRKLIEEKKLASAAVEAAAAEALRAVPHVFRVYTRDRLTGGAPEDETARRVWNSYYPSRSPDIEVLPEPYWTFYQKNASHGTTFSYDTHVPVIFMGPRVRPGRYNRNIWVNDIAPTLATLLEVETPSGSVGQVLAEIIE